MKSESTAHATSRARLIQSPVYFVRFFDVPVYGEPTENAFPFDFSTGPVKNPTRAKKQYIESISGAPAQVFPEQGRASIGGFSIRLVDIDGEVLKYLSFSAPTGQQIRPGQRAQVYSGYAELDESDYMPQVKMEVVDRRLDDITSTAFTVELADIQRSTRREVFLAATQESPFSLGPAHPLDLALQVLTSTGTGTNGAYDKLAAENGLAIPQAFVDVASFENAMALTPNDRYCFDITEPAIGKTWLEQEIYKTINAYPLVDQQGRLKVKLYLRFA